MTIGATWLEILILFELRGFHWAYTRQQVLADYQELVEKEDKKTKKWSKHYLAQGKTMERRPASMNEVARVDTLLHLFKRAVRFLTDRPNDAEDFITHIAFQQGQQHLGGIRLERMGVAGHNPCVRAIPVVSESEKVQIAEALIDLRKMGAKNDKVVMKKMLHGQEGPLDGCWVKKSHLCLAREPPWRAKAAKNKPDYHRCRASRNEADVHDGPPDDKPQGDQRKGKKRDAPDDSETHCAQHQDEDNLGASRGRTEEQQSSGQQGDDGHEPLSNKHMQQSRSSQKREKERRYKRL